MDDSMEVDYYGAERSLGTLEEEFHEALSHFSNEYGRSEDDQKVEASLLTALEDICKGRAKESHAIDTSKEVLLNAESVTWLLLNMRRCELDWEASETIAASQLVESNAYEVVEALEKDREFRRLECIVMWLEVQQREVLEDHQDEITGMSMWPGTRGWIKDGDRRWGEKDSLDPDAPYRRSLVYEDRVKKLSQVDEADDCKLLERVWRYIRAGKLEAAVDLCRRCGQAWRAASIGGGEPWVVVSESGRIRRFNSLRSLQWRIMCYKMANRLRDVESKQRHGDPKHRDSVVHWEWTVYAALASCPELLTESDKCKTWEDQCWAYFQAKREGYYANRLRQVREERRKCSELYPDLVPPDVENECKGITMVDRLSIEEIFGKIQSKSGSLQQERQLQAAIIKSSLDQVLKELPSEQAIQGLQAEESRKDGLRRLVVHLGIYVKTAMGHHFFGLPSGVQERLHELIEAYMDQLMACGTHVQLTALYAAYLPLPAMHRKFSDCMKAVHRSQDRQKCQAQCQEWLSSVLDIVLNDVLEHCRRCPFRGTSLADRRSAFEAEAELLRQDLRDVSPRLGDVASRVALPELLWLKALEWCRLGPHKISAYSLVHVNAFLRELVMTYTQETDADAGGGALISDSFRVIMAYAQHVLRVTPVYEAEVDMPVQMVGISREWGYWQAYSDAQDAYLGWQAAHADLSAQLETLARVGEDRSNSRDMAVTIATGAVLERIQGLTEILIGTLEEASRKLRAVLNPPDGGRWMRAVDTGASHPTQQDMVQQHIFNQARTEQRAEELRRLQATCIPELAAMLDRVYFETGSTVERAFVGRGAVGGLNPEFLASAREFTEDCYMLSMKVAEVVASPQFNLHDLFPKGPGQTDGSLLKKPFTLDDFMKRMERSSLALLKLTQSTQWGAIADRVKEKYEIR